MSQIQKFRMRREVEAVQWTGRNLAEIESLLDDHVEASPNNILYLATCEGVAAARCEDWILKGAGGVVIVCEPDDFTAIYEPALAGRDPEKLEGLLEAVRGVDYVTNSGIDSCDACAGMHCVHPEDMKRLFSALAAFEGRGE